MNENVKKVSIATVAAIALILAVWQGYHAMAGPAEVKHEIGHGTPGHGMKAAENEEAAAAAKGAAAKKDGAAGDPLAGPG